MRRSGRKRAYCCANCRYLKALGCAGGSPKYYCIRLTQLIGRPSNTGCSYCEEGNNAE